MSLLYICVVVNRPWKLFIVICWILPFQLLEALHNRALHSKGSVRANNANRNQSKNCLVCNSTVTVTEWCTPGYGLLIELCHMKGKWLSLRAHAKVMCHSIPNIGVLVISQSLTFPCLSLFPLNSRWASVFIGLAIVLDTVVNTSYHNWVHCRSIHKACACQVFPCSAGTMVFMVWGMDGCGCCFDCVSIVTQIRY